MIDSADFALQARAVKPSATDKHVLLGPEAKFERSRGKDLPYTHSFAHPSLLIHVRSN
jgi:hypothetical protein